MLLNLLLAIYIGSIGLTDTTTLTTALATPTSRTLQHSTTAVTGITTVVTGITTAVTGINTETQHTSRSITYTTTTVSVID